MGRPTKLTKEVQEKILTAIRAGNYAEVAARYAGISPATYYAWLERGAAEGKGPYLEFLEAVKSAEAQAEVALVAAIRKAVPDHWQAGMTTLERRFPERWGRRDAVDVTSKGEALKAPVIYLPDNGRSAPADAAMVVPVADSSGVALPSNGREA